MKEALEEGREDCRYEGDDGRLYDDDDGRRFSLDECDVLEEALKDVRSEAIIGGKSARSVRGTNLKEGSNMQEYCRLQSKVFTTI